MKLSDFEIEVLQLLWQYGEASAPQLHKGVLEEKEVTYSTVKTIVDRLEKKGAIYRSQQQGRTIFYTPLLEPSSTKAPLVSSFIKKLFGGKPSQLAAHIVKQEQLSKSEINYLEAILKERKKELNDD